MLAPELERDHRPRPCPEVTRSFLRNKCRVAVLLDLHVPDRRLVAGPDIVIVALSQDEEGAGANQWNSLVHGLPKSEADLALDHGNSLGVARVHVRRDL